MFTVKAKTERTKQIGVSILLYRVFTILILLSALLVKLWIYSFMFIMYYQYICVGLAVVGFAYYFLKKSLVARDFAFLVFGGSLSWIALVIQIYKFMMDNQKQPKTITVKNQK
jgi:hypothetical protein